MSYYNPEEYKFHLMDPAASRFGPYNHDVSMAEGRLKKNEQALKKADDNSLLKVLRILPGRIPGGLARQHLEGFRQAVESDKTILRVSRGRIRLLRHVRELHFNAEGTKKWTALILTTTLGEHEIGLTYEDEFYDAMTERLHCDNRRSQQLGSKYGWLVEDAITSLDQPWQRSMPNT